MKLMNILKELGWIGRLKDDGTSGSPATGGTDKFQDTMVGGGGFQYEDYKRTVCDNCGKASFDADIDDVCTHCGKGYMVKDNIK